LSNNKENAAIAAFFSEAQIVLIISVLPLVFALIAASRVNVFLQECGFYLILKGFISYNRKRCGASLKKNTVITAHSKKREISRYDTFLAIRAHICYTYIVRIYGRR